MDCGGFLHEESTRGSARRSINGGFEGREGEQEESNEEEERADGNGELSFRKKDIGSGSPEGVVGRF